MTDWAGFVRWIGAGLDRAGIPYMVSGSIASTFYGEHRATADMDVVIAPQEDRLADYVASIGPECYVSELAARDALRRRSMFNVVHYESGLKADLIVCKDRPFSRTEFARRRCVEFQGINLYVASPEDVILSKLEWCKSGESERQFRDALGVFIVQRSHIDLDYLLHWGRELNVYDLLQMVQAEAGKILADE